jgi:hypothetical protein
MRNRVPPPTSLQRPEDVIQEEWYKITLETVRFRSKKDCCFIEGKRWFNTKLIKKYSFCSVTTILANPSICLGENKDLGRRSRRDLKPRKTVLAKLGAIYLKPDTRNTPTVPQAVQAGTDNSFMHNYSVRTEQPSHQSLMMSS